MDPFRDELSAAHAKIAQLEERIRELQAVRVEPTPPTKSRGSQPSFLLLAAGVFVSFVMVGVIAFIYLKTSAPPISEPTSFKGIATAPAAKTSDVIPSIVNPGAVASASAKPASKPPCNCTPGDPLCTCL